MLQKLNDRIQGAVAWIIVVLVTITFTLFGLEYYLQSRRDSDAKVKINDHVVTKEAYDLNYRRLSQMQGAESLTPVKEKALKQQVLSDMITNAVSVDAARSYGFEVNAKQATAAIVQIPQFQEDGRFSTSRYTQALSNAFFTPQTFQQEVRQGMLLNQQRFALIGTAFVLPTELDQFIKLSMQTRDYQYAVIKATDFIAKSHVSDDEIRQYYQAHQKQFMTKEQISLDYIRVSLDAIKKKITIAPEQIARYYEDNKTNYMTPANWDLAYVRFPSKEQDTELDTKAKQAATELYDTARTVPARFAALAKQAVKAHAQSGVLPRVVAGQSDLDQYLINLTEPGQISPPIRTRHGYEVLQLKAYQPATIQPLHEVKQLIAEQLKQEAAQQQYAELEERVSELSYQNPDSLVPVAEALKLPLEHTRLFSRNHPSQEEKLTQYPSVMQAAFSHDVLTFGNNSEPIQLDADTLVVLRLKDHIPAALQDLTQVKSVITGVLVKQKAMLAAQQYGQSLILSAPDHVANTLRWQSVTAANRESDLSDPQINDMAFLMTDLGGYQGRVLQNGDFALVRLAKIEDGKLAMLDKEQMMNLTQQLEASYGLMDYDLYVSQLMAQAHIVTYP